jgi:hypothetical protein
MILPLLVAEDTVSLTEVMSAAHAHAHAHGHGHGPGHGQSDTHSEAP